MQPKLADHSTPAISDYMPLEKRVGFNRLREPPRRRYGPDPVGPRESLAVPRCPSFPPPTSVRCRGGRHVETKERAEGRGDRFD